MEGGYLKSKFVLGKESTTYIEMGGPVWFEIAHHALHRVIAIDDDAVMFGARKQLQHAKRKNLNRFLEKIFKNHKLG